LALPLQLEYALDVDQSLDVEILSSDLGPTGYLPRRIPARITPKDPTLPVCDLVLDRSHPHRDKRKLNPLQLRTVTISIRLPGCPVIDSTNMRVPIGHYVDEVIAAAIKKFEVREKLPLVWNGSRGRRVTLEQLEEVAVIYRDAVNAKRPPLREIEHRLGVARSTAGRYVVQARREGLIGAPPRPGVAGER
jgi:hypothetical protein